MRLENMPFCTQVFYCWHIVCQNERMNDVTSKNVKFPECKSTFAIWMNITAKPFLSNRFTICVMLSGSVKMFVYMISSDTNTNKNDLLACTKSFYVSFVRTSEKSTILHTPQSNTQREKERELIRHLSQQTITPNNTLWLR